MKGKFKVYNKENLDSLIQTVNSYLGFMRHSACYRLRKRILTDEGLLKAWLPYIQIDKEYRKITKKKPCKFRHKKSSKNTVSLKNKPL